MNSHRSILHVAIVATFVGLLQSVATGAVVVGDSGVGVELAAETRGRDSLGRYQEIDTADPIQTQNGTINSLFVSDSVLVINPRTSAVIRSDGAISADWTDASAGAVSLEFDMRMTGSFSLECNQHITETSIQRRTFEDPLDSALFSHTFSVDEASNYTLSFATIGACLLYTSPSPRD